MEVENGILKELRGRTMFEVGKKYKINTIKGRFYTGIVLEEDSLFVLINDKYNDKVGIKKEDIEEWKLMKDN